MKLLFDQNLSPVLVRRLADIFPDSEHVFHVALDREGDRAVRQYAEDHGYIIVTKDSDYSDLTLLLGYPPKVIWIRRGNCSTTMIELLIRAEFERIRDAMGDPDSGFVTIY